MSALSDRIAEVLRRDGWTCEYHEPVSGPGECSQCDDAHRRTAERIEAALHPMLSPTLIAKLQPEGSDLFIQKASRDNLNWTWRVTYCNGTTGQSDTRTGSSLNELLSAWSEVQQ